jgi:hypothetical protein
VPDSQRRFLAAGFWAQVRRKYFIVFPGRRDSGEPGIQKAWRHSLDSGFARRTRAPE